MNVLVVQRSAGELMRPNAMIARKFAAFSALEMLGVYAAKYA